MGCFGKGVNVSSSMLNEFNLLFEQLDSFSVEIFLPGS